jgi:hypothetical protein
VITHTVTFLGRHVVRHARSGVVRAWRWFVGAQAEHPCPISTAHDAFIEWHEVEQAQAEHEYLQWVRNL